MKKVLITGASGGIGAALALAFAKKGYGVALHYHRGYRPISVLLEQLCAIKASAVAVQADLRSETDVEYLFSRIGDIDVLINNAGISHFGLITDTTLSEWENIFAINTASAFLCSRTALPAMIRKKCGAIINISSVWGEQGASCEVAYSASKAAVIGFTKALAKEVGPSGIRVNCIAPGIIDTSMNRHLSDEELSALCYDTPIGRIGKPLEVAHAAVFLAENEFVTGQILGVDGGFK